MSNTAELQRVTTTVGAGNFPPPPPVAPSAAPVPPNVIDQTPLLPTVAPPVPRPATAPASPFASSMDNPWSTAPTPPKRTGPGRIRRAFSWLVVLGLLGGAGYAGVRWGPDLVALATGDDTIDEPAAPLAFPDVVPVPIRSATFTVERVDPVRGRQITDVSTDFETGISRLVLDRGDAPDIEILTVFDQAVVRRIDQPTWYRLDRGALPADAESGRLRWVRTIDELIPPALRPTVTIDRATESTVDTTMTRRLLMTVDPSTLVQVTTPVVPTAPADGSPAPPPAPPAVTLPPGVALQIGTDPIETLRIEAWVDSTGVVRKSIMPAALGGETITVTSVSADAWLPPFPTDEMVMPLTAAVLLELGL
jgi:hypothetical protein